MYKRLFVVLYTLLYLLPIILLTHEARNFCVNQLLIWIIDSETYTYSVENLRLLDVWSDQADSDQKDQIKQMPHVIVLGRSAALVKVFLRILGVRGSEMITAPSNTEA